MGHLCLYLVLSLIAVYGNRQSFDHDSNNIVLTLQSQDQDLNSNEYSCTVQKSQLRHSKLVSDLVGHASHHDAILMTHANTEYSDLQVPIPYDPDNAFLKNGFHDMCDYLQNVDFDDGYYDKYQLPMPLLLDDSNDFYNDLKQLTNQEILFMKQIELFDDSHNDNNINSFDINLPRMYNLFKIAEFLQIKRLLTIIAARQASLMTNMTENTMIQWLLENPSTKKQMLNTNNNDEYTIMAPLLPQIGSSGINGDDTEDDECTNSYKDCRISINDIKKYNWVLLSQILPFFSCPDIRTFSSISNEFYHFANEWGHMHINIDPMIKILTQNTDATCLSLINQEVLFYKPFLTLPKNKWNENQNTIYNQLKRMKNNYNRIDVHVQMEFDFRTLICFGDKYLLYALECRIQNDIHSIEIDIIRHFGRDSTFGGISLKFGKFAQQVNMFAQLKGIEYIAIGMYSFAYFSSFDDLIGISDINNIKQISISEHSFALIDFEEIYNINSQIEYIHMVAQNTDARSVKNIPFLSKMKSLKELILCGNNLDSFDFDALKGITDLRVLIVEKNRFNYKPDTQCLDFEFLHNVPNLEKLHLKSNQIECINNFLAIQKHSNLVSLKLKRNKISSLDLNAFQGTHLKHVDLSWNKLGNVQLSHDHDDTSQLQQCLDFNSFNNMQQLQSLHLEVNQIQCIINFESIQQHTKLKSLHLEHNPLLSLPDFAKFDESKQVMNDLQRVYFDSMNLEYTMKNKNCLDLQFLKFMPNVTRLYFSDNKIECIDNVSILQREDIKLEYINLDNNNLLSFDFEDLIGSNIDTILLTNNNLSFESLKNFNVITLSKINPGGAVSINITHGNDIKVPRMMLHGFFVEFAIY